MKHHDVIKRRPQIVESFIVELVQLYLLYAAKFAVEVNCVGNCQICTWKTEVSWVESMMGTLFQVTDVSEMQKQQMRLSIASYVQRYKCLYIAGHSNNLVLSEPLIAEANCSDTCQRLKIN